MKEKPIREPLDTCFYRLEVYLDDCLIQFGLNWLEKHVNTWKRDDAHSYRFFQFVHPDNFEWVSEHPEGLPYKEAIKGLEESLRLTRWSVAEKMDIVRSVYLKMEEKMKIEVPTKVIKEVCHNYTCCDEWSLRDLWCECAEILIAKNQDWKSFDIEGCKIKGRKD